MSTMNQSTRVILETLRRALAGKPEPLPSDSKKARGAVGVLIKEEEDDLWLLMIKRWENPRDLWSGQMAFPGGHADPQDRALFDTVAREALEEVGIDMRKQEFLGCLSNQQLRIAPMIVSPFIFVVQEKVAPVTSREAEEVLWIPMSFLLNPKNISSIKVQMGREQVSMGCYRYSDRIIWGLSFRIIQEIISKITSSR